MPQSEVADNTDDRRRREPGTFFVLDNMLIDDYAPLIGPHALSVYVYMRRFGSRNGRVWHGHATMAAELGISRPTVVKAAICLFEAGLVSLYCPLIERSRGGWKHMRNTSYQLLPVTPPLPRLSPAGHVNDVDTNNADQAARSGENERQNTGHVNDVAPACKSRLPGHVSLVDTNNTLLLQTVELDRIHALTVARASDSERDEENDVIDIDDVFDDLFGAAS